MSGEGDSGNPAFEIVNNTLRARASFNFEQTPSYEIRVRSTDVGGLGTDRLTFRYSPVRGDTDTDGVALGQTVRMPRGVLLRDAEGRRLSLAVPAVDTRGVLVDARAPFVRSLVSPAPGTYRPGRELLFTAVLSERVTVTGPPPTIAFSFGTTRRRFDGRDPGRPR